MGNSEISEDTPQKSLSQAPGVSLTHAETYFLDLLTDPMRDDEAFTQSAISAGLTEDQIGYIEEWVCNKGCHFLTCEYAKLNHIYGAETAFNPKVRKIIDAAAERGLCRPTVADKGECEMVLTQMIRAEYISPVDRKAAVKELNEMRGNYPSTGTSQDGKAIQIIIADPYAKVAFNAN